MAAKRLHDRKDHFSCDAITNAEASVRKSGMSDDMAYNLRLWRVMAIDYFTELYKEDQFPAEYSAEGAWWNHGLGRSCFGAEFDYENDRRARKERIIALLLAAEVAKSEGR